MKSFDKDLAYIPMLMLNNKKNELFNKIMSSILSSDPKNLNQYNLSINNKKWIVFENSTFKIIREITDNSYNEFYDYITGFTLRFGKTLDENPTYCELGNTIADIEIVSGKCPKINGKNCRFCYKSNGGDIANCMSLNEAERLLDFINQNHQLQQVAWGITGFYTNPEFEHILELCHNKHITPNYTTNGVDLDDHSIEITLNNCGRVAVSCYEDAKEICYSTIKKFGDAAKKINKQFPCNIHVVLSKDTYSHVMSVLKDAADGKIENLGAIVMLRMKNVGRAKNLDPHISDSMYEEIISFCIKNNIKFGFDSCGCHRVEDILKKIKREDLISSIEPCESSRFSGYWNVSSKYYNCSFCEQLSNHTAIDPYKFKTYTEFWHSDEVKMLRFPKDGWMCKSCPFIKID